MLAQGSLYLLSLSIPVGLHSKHSTLVQSIRLDCRPPPISSSEKDITRKERSTLAQLRSRYCRLLGSYKSRIKKDASLNLYADCGTTPHDVKHLFVCPAHPTTKRPSNLWSRPTDAVRELSYLEARNEHGLKGEQQEAMLWRGGPTLAENRL